MNQNGNINRKQKKMRHMQNDIVDLSIYIIYIIYMYVIILYASVLACYIILNHICYVLPLMKRPFITNWDAKWPRRTCHPRCAKASQRAFGGNSAFRPNSGWRSGMIWWGSADLKDHFDPSWFWLKIVDWFFWVKMVKDQNGQSIHPFCQNQSIFRTKFDLKIQKPLHTMRGNCEVMRCQGWFGSEPFPLILRIYFTEWSLQPGIGAGWIAVCQTDVYCW